MSAVTRLTRVELKLLVREPFTLLFVFLFPIVVLLVLGGVFSGDPGSPFEDTPAIDYYIPGYIGTVITALSLVGIPVHLAAYRERGILRRFIASSVGGETILVAQMIVSVILAAFGAMLLLISALLIYDIQAPDRVLEAILAFLIGTLSFVMIGLFLGMVLPTARSAQAVGLGLFFPMWMLSGAGPPREIMSGTMRTVSDILPMTHLVTALQGPWFRAGSELTQLGILLMFLVAAGGAALWRIRSE